MRLCSREAPWTSSARSTMWRNYDAIRPRYPGVLINELVRRAGLGGCKAPRDRAGNRTSNPSACQDGLASPVSSLAPTWRVARDRLKAYPNVKIVNASFEAAQLPMATFRPRACCDGVALDRARGEVCEVACTAQGLGPSRHYSSALCFGRARRCVHRGHAAHLSALRAGRSRGRQDVPAAMHWGVGAGAHPRGVVCGQCRSTHSCKS
jgi:hypothetical protein